MVTYIGLGKHWLRQLQHQAIIWTDFDYSSVRSYGIHLSAISQEALKISILDMSLKMANLTATSPRGL